MQYVGRDVPFKQKVLTFAITGSEKSIHYQTKKNPNTQKNC